MKNKAKYIPSIAALIFITSCSAAGLTEGYPSTETSSGTAAVSAESTAGSSSESPIESSSSSVTDAPAVTAGEFVKVEVIDTDFGTINYPVFDEEMLDPDDTKAANALFEYIKDDLLKYVEELKELYADAASAELDRVQPPASETYISLYDGILSVLVNFEYAFGFPGTCCSAVNFDISTGKAIGVDELANAASLTVDDVKQSILWYTKTYILNERDALYISGCLDADTLPEFYSHDGLFNDEKVICEIALDNYDNGNEYSAIESDGKPWEKLPLEHTAFISESGQLYVFGTIAPAGQIAGKMVAIARGDEKTAEVNLVNEFGAMQRKSYIMPENIPQILENIVDAEIKPDYKTESIASVYDMEEWFTVYVTDVFSNTGFAPALVARYAVSLFDGYIWEMDDYGQWIMIN